MFERSSGILMHISSFPSKYGIGDFGKEGYKFIDFLKESNQKLWQILPLGQTGYGDSPYQSFSAFAGNPYFIDLEDLVKRGLLEDKDLENLKEKNKEGTIDFEFLYYNRYPVLEKAYENFLKKEEKEIREGIEKFKIENSYWLPDYSLFMAIKGEYNGVSWQEWPKKYKYRKKGPLREIRKRLGKEIELQVFLQYIFSEQWNKLKKYANENNIKVVGDIPIFIAEDSADAWSKTSLFQMDRKRKPVRIAGCPPDAFSEDGQLWGNPLYNWEKNKETGYAWWVERVRSCFTLYDIVRIDHFRGFDSYWSIPAGEKTAKNGKWITGPGIDLFNKISEKLGKLPIIAEDLGFLTPSVEKLLADSGYPGMNIMQFGFDDIEGRDYPINYKENSVAYIGTHDNSTAVGWYQELSGEGKENCDQYIESLGLEKKIEIHLKLIEGLFKSNANQTIIQLQDLLGLDDSGRMNIPGTPSGNWVWRLKEDELNIELAKKLKEISKKYMR